jgi:hypothetical protein
MRKTPTTLGVLSMVFGGLVALYSLVGLAFSTLGASFMNDLASHSKSLPAKPGQPDPTVMFSHMQELNRQLAPYTDALALSKVVFSLALVIIGWGLYKRRRWGRSGAIAWGALALVELAAEAIVRLGYIQPRVEAAMTAAMASLPNPAAAQMMSTIGATGIVLGVFFYAPFPLVLLALCGRRSAAADFVD